MESITQAAMSNPERWVLFSSKRKAEELASASSQSKKLSSLILDLGPTVNKKINDDDELVGPEYPWIEYSIREDEPFVSVVAYGERKV